MAVSTHTFLSVWSCPLPPWRLSVTLQRSQRPKGSGHRCLGIDYNSHGIRAALATCLSEQIPDPAKNSTKAIPRLFACRGEATPHPILLTQAESAVRLESQRPSASTITFMEPQGNNNKLSQLQNRGGALPPSPDVHTVPVTK